MAEQRKIPDFSPATTQRASEVVYEQIYNRIVSSELKAGDRLPSERALSEQFQRSRHIIREALRMLQQDGLVRIEVGSTGGAIVQGISIQTVEEPLKKFLSCGAVSLDELTEYRNINDYGCAKLAAIHYTEEDAQRMREILERARECIDDPEQFRQYDTAFHCALAAASHNHLAIIINDVIVGLNTRMIADSTREYTLEQQRELNRKVYESHSELFQAVLTRNPVAAVRRVDKVAQLFRGQFSGSVES